ncbi:signal peptidase [Simiduia agarivorans SA1 = DSM 21679]|uniref:Signal peptidase n=2 Tax=Simiduia TaxID=447467 RepID=K4KTK8_SIMAS|nr:signal peptidase [Simiduia agarivorans SA1 = DSM 21679]
MQPALQAEDIVLADTWVDVSTLIPGDIIVFEHPTIHGMRLIKRIAKIDTDTVMVLGDNAKNSLDSRSIGNINKQLILAKASAYIRSCHIGKIADIEN